MAKNQLRRLESNMLVYRNNLLGYFNTNNIYIINPEVMENLIELKKVVLDRNGATLKCNSYLHGFGNIDFEITFKYDNPNAVCELYLVENINKINGLVRNPLKTKIAVYQNKFDKNFITKMIYAFNLVEDSTCMEQPNLEEMFKSYIYIRKNYNEKLYLKEQDNYNKMFKNLVDTQLKYFSKGKSQFCKDVYKLFNQKKVSIKDNYLKQNKNVDYFAIYELLNACVDYLVTKNPKYKKDEKEYQNHIFQAVQFAYKSIQEINNNFKKNQIKLIEKDGDKLKAEQNKEDLNKVLNRKQKILNDNRLMLDNLYIFGNLSNFNNLEVDDLKQLFLYNNGNYKGFLGEKFIENEALSKVLDFAERVNNGFRECFNLPLKDLDGDGKIETLDGSRYNSLEDIFKGKENISKNNEIEAKKEEFKIDLEAENDKFNEDDHKNVNNNNAYIDINDGDSMDDLNLM